MITADHLDSLLNIWARAKLSDGAIFRNLGYPQATPEERYVRRGGISSSGAQLHTPGAEADAFERTDAAIAKLKQSQVSDLYSVLCSRWLEIGPDESRARRLRLTPDKFKSKLNSARRFLRQELDR